MRLSDKTNSNILLVRMFGEFSMSNDIHTLNASSKNGKSSILLISYLLSNKGADITSDALFDLLWPDGESNNPAGALRTLCHRTRKLLLSFFPEQNVELILRTNNIYSWNPDVPCKVDVQEFERCCHQAFREPDPEAQYALLYEAFAMYKGEFLPIFSSQSWVIFRSNYYGNLYIKCVNQMCQYLEMTEQYDALLTLCNNALELAPPADETLHKRKICALLYLEQTQGALDYYYSVLSIASQKYGIDITDSMQDVYQQILLNMPNQYQTLHSLEKNLRKKEFHSGSFFCNFDIFQNIYQVNLRSVRRSQSRHFLILLTLSDNRNPSLLTTELKEEMEILHNVMEKLLRSNDVYTKSSICQFSLIISVPNENGCTIVTRRLLDTYVKKNQHPGILLQMEAKEIL